VKTFSLTYSYFELYNLAVNPKSAQGVDEERRWIYNVYTMATIQKWGNSLGLRIPKDIAEELGLVPGKQVELEKHGDALTVRAKKIPRYSLEELLKDVTPDNVHEEIDWGPPRGKEIW
jgi:antitoxin MazE